MAFGDVVQKNIFVLVIYTYTYIIVYFIQSKNNCNIFQAKLSHEKF